MFKILPNKNNINYKNDKEISVSDHASLAKSYLLYARYSVLLYVSFTYNIISINSNLYNSFGKNILTGFCCHSRLVAFHLYFIY